MKKLIILSILLFSCAITPKSTVLRSLELGMNKNLVIETIGEPSVVRGAMVNKFGQTIEVWEYVLANRSTDSVMSHLGKASVTILSLGMFAPAMYHQKTGNYWLVFSNGTLIQWGAAGDWDSARRQIYDVRFNEPVLH